jgi:Flp pilus assembly pilin Flp
MKTWVRETMLAALNRYWRCESGVNAIEYCVIGCTLSLAILPAVYSLSGSLSGKLNDILGYFQGFNWN